jgi:hypothetical protein
LLTLRWREPDSNHRSRSCERLIWALPIGDGGTKGEATYRFRSETAMLVWRGSPHSLSLRGGIYAPDQPVALDIWPRLEFRVLGLLGAEHDADRRGLPDSRSRRRQRRRVVYPILRGFVLWPFATVALQQATGSFTLAFLTIPIFMVAMAAGVWFIVPEHAGKELNAIARLSA